MLFMAHLDPYSPSCVPPFSFVVHSSQSVPTKAFYVYVYVYVYVDSSFVILVSPRFYQMNRR